MKNHDSQFDRDMQLVRMAGQFMIQWEKERGKEIESRVFLLMPETEERIERIEKCIQAAKVKPYAFRTSFDPIYNQINITVEDDVFSSGCLDLRAILGEADSYCMDALEDGCLVLEIGIHHAAYEVEK